MQSAADPVRLYQLIEELHARKKWLDRVIASLETAVESPDYRLIAALTEVFERDETSADKIDLREFQHSRIEKLAAGVTLRKRSPKAARISVSGPQTNGVPRASSLGHRVPLSNHRTLQAEYSGDHCDGPR